MEVAGAVGVEVGVLVEGAEGADPPDDAVEVPEAGALVVVAVAEVEDCDDDVNDLLPFREAARPPHAVSDSAIAAAINVPTSFLCKIYEPAGLFPGRF